MRPSCEGILDPVSCGDVISRARCYADLFYGAVLDVSIVHFVVFLCRTSVGSVWMLR